MTHAPGAGEGVVGGSGSTETGGCTAGPGPKGGDAPGGGPIVMGGNPAKEELCYEFLDIRLPYRPPVHWSRP